MRATILLADFAQVAEGKLSLLGGGWVFKGQDTPMALGIVLEIPWDEADRPHHWTVLLVDGDGHPVPVTGVGDAPPQPLAVSGQVQVGRPPGYPAGVPFNAPLAINFGPIPLPTGQRFTFQLEVDGKVVPEGEVSFSTRSVSSPSDGEITG